MKIRGLVAVAVISVFAAGGCHDATPKTLSTTTDNQLASSTTTPNKSQPEVAGTLAQIVIKSGRYIFGKDLEPGKWIGISLDQTCNYTTARKIFDDSRPVTDKLPEVGTPPTYDSAGAPIGDLIEMWFAPGDVLEILPNESFPSVSDCQFWNDGTKAPPIPAGSDVPWRDVDQGTIGVDDWKMGQFDYLDAVKKRVNNFDETQLTLMGFWACKVPMRDATSDTLRHFANLTPIQADYLITTSYKYMCPNVQHS
jgi:hypothetical protein